MRKICALVLLALVLVSYPLKASLVEEVDLSVDGKITERITYSFGEKEWQNLLTAGLRLNCDYGYNLSVTMHPELIYETSFAGRGNLQAGLKEGYLDIYLNALDLRIGKQLMNWGSAYKFNPTDKVNPMDLTAADPTAGELGVLALKGEYYLGANTVITGVVVGEFVPTVLPENVTQAQTDLLLNGIYQQILSIVQDPVRASMLMNNLSVQTNKPAIKGPGDLEYACKITRRDLFGSDVSLSFFRGYEDVPALHSNLPEVVADLLTGAPAQIDFTYKRTSSVGFDLIGDIKGVGFWSETAVNFNESEEKILEMVLGGDYTFRNNLYTVLQYYHRNPLDTEKDGKNYLMLHTQLPLWQIHQMSTTVLCDLSEQAVVLVPEVKLSLHDNLSLQIGTLYSAGLDDNTDSFLSTLGDTRTYMALSYGF